MTEKQKSSWKLDRRPKETFLQIRNTKWPKGTCKDAQRCYLLERCKSNLQWSPLKTLQVLVTNAG